MRGENLGLQILEIGAWRERFAENVNCRARSIGPDHDRS
jgi:hypothetical protein